MAFERGIDYLDPNYSGLDWADIKSPWSHPSREGTIASVATAQAHCLDGAGPEETSVILDSPDIPLCSNILFVILGPQ